MKRGIHILIICIAILGMLAIWVGLSGREPIETAVADDTLSISANVSDAVGSAAVLSDFMCTEGGPAGDPASEQWESDAWRNLRYMEGKYMTFFSPGNTLEDSGGSGMVVVRDPKRSEPNVTYFGPKKDLWLDVRAFDGMNEYSRKGLGYQTRIFEISMMPNTLSFCKNTQHSAACAPYNAAEFEEAVYHAVRHLNRLGIKAPIIPLFGEPESWENFRGKNRSLQADPTDQARLNDYMTMYIAAYRGAQRANPQATILGPISSVYSSALAISISGGAHHWGFDDFVRKLRDYNRAHPMAPVVPKAVGWQGYDWDNSRRLWNGVHHVQRVLRQNGFNPNTPQILMGWNAEWATNRPLPMPGYAKAAHIITNVFDQLNPGGQRSPIAKACYYTWNLDGVPGTDADPYQSLVYAVKQETLAKTRNPSLRQNCKRQSYAAFEVLRDMRDGQFVRTRINGNPPNGLFQVATVRQPNHVFRMTLANNSGELKLVSLRFTQMPLAPGTAVHALFQRINAERSTDCNGLEGGDGFTFPIAQGPEGGALEMPVLDMPPYSVMMVTVWPAGIVQ